MDLVTAVRKVTEYMIAEDPDRVDNAYDAVTFTRVELDTSEVASWGDDIINQDDREAMEIVLSATGAELLKALQSL